MQNFHLDSDLFNPHNLSTALRFLLCMILLRITIVTLYKLSKPPKVKRKNIRKIEKSCSASTLIDETEQEENLLEKLNHVNDLDEFLHTQVELEALKYKKSL